MIRGQANCFCLPGFQGEPPSTPCAPYNNPCDSSPCGPNTQCSILPNGIFKCTCLPGFIESPNTIRGCIQQVNPCEPNFCGHNALCDPRRVPSCYCPESTTGNPYKSCTGTSLYFLISENFNLN